MDEHIRDQITNSRREYPDRSLVVYDLTTGVDFSKPRNTAEALADVFFHMDASKWFREEGDKLVFKAGNRVEIRIADEHNRKIEKTVEDFRKDLRNDEVKKEYVNEIEAAATYNAGLGFMIIGGVMNAMLMEAMVRRDQKNQYVGQLLQDTLSNVKIENVA